MQQAGTAIYKVEDMEFGRRLAVERELELPGADDRIPGMYINAVWDESGSFVIYPTLLGIKGESGIVTVDLMVLTVWCSRQHGHEQGRQTVWERRNCAVHAPDSVPGCASKERSHDGGE